MERLTASERQARAGKLQGAELIDVVIERVRRDPRPIAGFCGDYPLTRPQPMPPEALASLTFPSGKPLPPSLRRWLAFDTSWLESLGWFANGRFTPRRVDAIVTAEFEPLWGEMYQPLADRMGECFLLPEGTDSRRIFAVTEPDALGEYPVLVIDVDDLPYAAVMYPGFDVYMADLSGLAIHTGDTYEDLADDPRYLTRMRHHTHHLFRGKNGIEIYDPEWGDLEETEEDNTLENHVGEARSASAPPEDPHTT